LCLFLGIVVLLGSKAIPQGGPLQRGRIRQQTGYDLEVVLNAVMDLLEERFLLLDLAFGREP